MTTAYDTPAINTSDSPTRLDSPSVAVIGCGAWGKNLVRNFNQLGSLAIICDQDPSGRERSAQFAPAIPFTAELKVALQSNIAGVVIATPAETHFKLARMALEAGKDVFVEKPLALTYDEGRYLVDLAASKSLVLMVGHVLEYHPGIRALQDLVSAGALGKIQYIYSNRLSLGKIRREENILWSFAPHDVAVILRLMKSMPFQISASGGSYIQPNIADVTVTNLLFNNGVRAHIHVSWLHPFKEQRLVVIGTKKMASFDDVSKQLVLYDQRVEWKEGQPIPVRSDGEPVAFKAQEPLRLEADAFLKAIETRQAPLTDGLSGLRVLQVLQAAQQSLVTGGTPVPLLYDILQTNGASNNHD
ncbi:MAG: Gfo/Idh/MocA family oxidoreductase [Anaerolineales bacterium]|nr:Gfo/Idh/MocA family oxidoreductase [Anaerolineales bacterium]